MLKNAYLDAKIGVDTEENELSKVCRSKQAKTHPRSKFGLCQLLLHERFRRGLLEPLLLGLDLCNGAVRFVA